MILPRRRKRDSFLPWVQLGVDVAFIYLFLWAVFWFRFKSGYFESLLGEPDHAVYYKSFHLIMLILVFFLRLYGLYHPANLLTFSDETRRVLKAVLSCTVVLMGVTFFVRGFSFSRTFLILAGVALAGGLSLCRFLLGLLVMRVDQKRGSLRNVLVIGCDENAKKLLNFYRRNPRFGTRVAAFLDEKIPKGSVIEGAPVLGRPSMLKDFLKREDQIHEVVLASQGMPTEKILEMISECEKEMVAFRWISDIFGLLASKMSVATLGGVPLLSFTDSPLSDWENRLLKRSVDIALSLTALIFLSPVFAWIAFLIKRDSQGPVFYEQERVGQDGRRFKLLKFRTMRLDAEAGTGAVWAVENDPRRTRAGARLRRSNLDELPQLWNVLKGDMSLVGPRPERPVFVSQFKEDIPRYMARHSIRSGITGWAQVNGMRGNTSIEERTKFDLYYIENWSLWFDFTILFKTLFARQNAY